MSTTRAQAEPEPSDPRARKLLFIVCAHGGASVIDSFLPVLDKQLKGRDYILGPLSVVDFLIGPRFDTAPAILNIDVSPYKNITAWHERLRAKPYWQDA